MDYFTGAALVLMSIAVYLVYRHKQRIRGKSVPFQKNRPAARKRRRRSVLDRDRGKVIAFPGNAGQLRQNESGQNNSGRSEHGQNSSGQAGSRQTRSKQTRSGQNSPNSRQNKK